MNRANNKNLILDRSTRFLKYLQELIKQRLSVPHDIDQFNDVIWINSIPQHQFCDCAIWDYQKEDSDSIWIEIKRPILPKTPILPKELSNWVEKETLENWNETPIIKEEIFNNYETEEDSENYLKFSNFPDLEEKWQDYLDVWKDWAKDYSLIKKIQDIYSRMFYMHQQQKLLGETFEVIIGLGLFGYNNKEGMQVYRHIISAQTELDFEPKNGKITVKASPEGANLVLETEMLNLCELPEQEIIENIEESLKDISSNIWAADFIGPVIKSWVNSFNPKAEYENTIIPFSRDSIKEYPLGAYAPALILRKRSGFGIINFLKKTIEQIELDQIIPKSLEALLTISSDKEEDGNSISMQEKKEYIEPEELFFPLPFNEDQEHIVKLINNSKGILVQGPPGTGKSHTIANLICHFIAQGKKVLITSQTSRALKVLKDKIPKQVQALCVSVLGNSAEDLDNLMGAVHQITNNYNYWDLDKNKNNIISLEDELSSLKKYLQKTKEELSAIREKETYKYEGIANKYFGTAEEIAKELNNEKDKLGWIPDIINPEELNPISNEEFNYLIDLGQKFNTDSINGLSLKRIKINDIFSPDEYEEIIENEKNYLENEKLIENDYNLKKLYDNFKNLSKDIRKNLLETLLNLDKAKSEACRRPLKWLKEAVYAILGDQDQSLKNLFDITNDYLKILKEKALNADNSNFHIPEKYDIYKVKADASELIIHLKSGRNLGWTVFKSKISKQTEYLQKEVFVDGKVCDNIICLEKLVNFIDVVTTLERLRKAWKDKVEIKEGTYSSQAALFIEQLEALDSILAIKEPLLKAKKSIHDLKTIPEPFWHEDTEINKYINVLERTLIVDEKNNIDEKVKKIKKYLKALVLDSNAHQINIDLLDALGKNDFYKWQNNYSKLKILEEDSILFEKYKIILERLKEKAPILTKLISSGSNIEILKEKKELLEESWSWARAVSWLTDFGKKHDILQLQSDYEVFEKKIKSCITELSATKAWEYCYSRITEEQRQYLNAWSHTMQMIGKGTGKRAEKYRRDAKEYMDICRDVIPAWILPIYRVVETIKPKSEIFDVVIIDEASQCGPESLFLTYIAKKCIVVGDDQQISPENVGSDREEVDLLIKKYLWDIPLKEKYNLESSLFTHANIRYGSKIFLKEHFRCVPEIIGFSNEICYIPLGYRLIPLRTYTPDRLEPIILKHVKEGYREGKRNPINKPEAEALVNQIRECCFDSKYENKSIGVISLLGENQANYIKNKLLKEIGPEEINKRKIICGDAYDFQGDERDIIFLSLVAATNERIGYLTKDTDKRRFNVAVSRARDQLWVFHSATINDFGPNDYRYKLLNYCTNPKTFEVKSSLNIDELKNAAKFSKRTNDNVPEPFDSWFEIDVFLNIIEKGYKAIPQFQVNDKRIDIVVEDNKNRIAIECDGDLWHGPEKYEQDTFRQRMLQRAGWKFWRIMGSSYYFDQIHSLDSLWEFLEKVGIKNESQIQIPSSKNGFQEKIFNNEKENLIDKNQKENKEISKVIKKTNLKKDNIKSLKLDSEMVKQNLILLLNESTQGEDLIADKVLRNLGIDCRGKNREKLKKSVLRIVNNLKKNGVVKEYKTQNRKRFKLIEKSINRNLFNWDYK